MTLGDVDFEVLSELYAKGGCGPAKIDWLNGDRDPRNRETKAGNLKHGLANRGRRFSLEEIQEAFEVLADANCGSYKKGRPLGKSRLVWRHSAREIAESVVSQLERGDDSSDMPSASIQSGEEARDG